MIIISNRPGQLGNLIFIYANFLAYGIENRIKIRNPAFYEYRSYFIGSLSSSGSKLFYRFCYFISRILFKLKIRTGFITVIALDWGTTFDLENAPQLKSTFCFVQGWLFRSDNLVIKHKKKIVDFFTPNDLLKHRLDEFFKQFNKNETILGIHIRHGDYKTFEDGKYFYSVEQYLEIIKKLAVLFENKTPHFLICSNEKINLSDQDIKGLKITYAPGHELLDMYCLANCSYITGPPSTYSMWASYYGNVPLYIIHDINKNIETHDFKINLSS